MRKSFALLPVLFLLFQLNACSQSKNSILRIYNNEAIYRFGNKYMNGNEHLSFQDQDKEFTTPGTRKLYHKSKRVLSESRIFNLASLGVFITSVFTKTNVTGPIEFAVGTGALGLGGIYFQTESSKYSERAIWGKPGIFYRKL
ncbi:hypothetical protein FW778_21835 [Ginsengibacter hankyongi]|uniref:Lipoprotein n=1 Tax=Ginsengibacter hankyongi TaxID=2607284 RepID=A0A5J5IA14_9BACT|nr:hypothetical protein [Ginsengibacter hankyongi]KAA9034654.1 hypothetical protein FW778_21835 [Ginsengibacter hankyongi]